MINNYYRGDLKDFKSYEAQGANYKYKLDANESFLSFPGDLHSELLNAVETSLLNRYPDPSSFNACSLYADYAGVKSENLMAGNGSDELISIIINTFIAHKDKVAVLSPDFSMYSIYTRIAGGDMIVFPLNEDFSVDSDALINMVNRENVKIIFLSNPNNPTGRVIPEADLSKIIEECRCIVVVDEAYFEFYGKTMVSKVCTYENLIVLRTCSKAIGLAATRLGFLITNDILLREVKKVKPPFNVNSMTQAIASIILGKPYIIQKNVESIIRERNYLYKKLMSINGFRVYPSEGNFILFEVSDAGRINRKLLKGGISIRSFNSERLKNCLRVTTGNREENDYFLEYISKAGGED